MTAQTILIADDDCDLVKVLSLRCRQLGADVIVAYDAMTALKLIHRERPDLICLDVNMPAGNGLSVCEMIGADESLASIPVIMLTGRADEETIRRCHTLCVYYVLKSQDVWQRMEPIVRELLDLEPISGDTSEVTGSTGPQHGDPSSARRDLSELCRVITREICPG